MAPSKHQRSRRARIIAASIHVGDTARVTAPSQVATTFIWTAGTAAPSDRIVGLASFCAAWIALYLAARLHADEAAWSHWAGGVLVGLAWLLTLPVR